MSKFKKYFLALILSCSVLFSALGVSAERFEGNANENLSPLQIQLIRNAHENVDNYFMPDSWFIDKTDRNFSDTVLIYFVDGYELNLEDFSSINYKEIKPAPEYDEEYSENSFSMSFNSFDDLYNSYNALSEISVIDNIDGLWSFNEPHYAPTSADLEEYGTVEVSQEYKNHVFGKFGVTNDGDIDEDDEITINDVVSYFRFFANPQTKLGTIKFYQADIYQDGKVDVIDAVVCVNKILGIEE
jgi:hypothetical protein